MDKANQNFILSSCEDVKEICDGSLSSTAISYYNFVRLYKDGSRISLSNDQAWTKYFLNECHKYELVFEGEITQEMYKYIIGSSAKSVGLWWLLKCAELMIQRYLQTFHRLKTVRFSDSEFCFVV